MEGSFKEFLLELLEALFSEFDGGNGEGEGDNGETPPPPVPVPFSKCRASDMMRFFNEHNVVWACDPQFGMEDEWFHFPTDIEDTMEELYYPFASEAPPYTPNTKEDAGYDCDNFAKDFSSWVSMKSQEVLGKQANAVWEVWGLVRPFRPENGHAWNIAIDGTDVYEIEPQTGEVWVFGSNPDYRAIIAK